MKPGKIYGETRALGAPVDWDEAKYGPCGSLSIKDERDKSGLPSMTSCWMPSDEERERIANGGAVYLNVVGAVHPPVMLWVGPPAVKLKVVKS